MNESLGISAKLFKLFNLLNGREKALPNVQQWVFQRNLRIIRNVTASLFTRPCDILKTQCASQPVKSLPVDTEHTNRGSSWHSSLASATTILSLFHPA